MNVDIKGALEPEKTYHTSHNILNCWHVHWLQTGTLFIHCFWYDRKIQGGCELVCQSMLLASLWVLAVSTVHLLSKHY